MAPGDFKSVAAGNANAWLARAGRGGRPQVDRQTVAMVSDRPHEAILAAATAHGCDLIYMASHGKRGLVPPSHRHRHREAEIATVPVLVVRVESNAALTAEQRAVTVIRNEHRSLAAVIRVMLDVTARCVEPTGHRPPVAGLRALLHRALPRAPAPPQGGAYPVSPAPGARP